jgi:hypothetical protein
MRQDQDLMQRRAAADPLPDAVEFDAEAEALLARLLVTPPEPAAPKRHRARRWTIAVATGACVAAAAFVAVNVVDSDSAVEQAVAALSQDDSVYHVIRRRTIVGGPPSRYAVPVFIESWYSSDGRVHEKYFADEGGRPGRLLEEDAGGRAWRMKFSVENNTLSAVGFGRSAAADDLPVIDPAADPGATMRALEARGALKDAGTTSTGDHRLVSDSIETDGVEYRFEYVVDDVTYLPLTQRWTTTIDDETHGITNEFSEYERLPLDASSRAELDLDPHPDARCSAEAIQATARDLGFPNPCAR